jgi:hypothetical protein
MHTKSASTLYDSDSDLNKSHNHVVTTTADPTIERSRSPPPITFLRQPSNKLMEQKFDPVTPLVINPRAPSRKGDGNLIAYGVDINITSSQVRRLEFLFEISDPWRSQQKTFITALWLIKHI